MEPRRSAMGTLIRIARAISLSVFLAMPTAALAADIAGNWFDNTGDAVINIFKAGPEYASSLPVTQGDVPAGSPHAQPGRFKNSVTDFSASDSHLHFKVVKTVL